MDRRRQDPLVLARTRRRIPHAPGVPPRPCSLQQARRRRLNLLPVQRRPRHLPQRPRPRPQAATSLRRQQHVGYHPHRPRRLQTRLRKPHRRSRGDRLLSRNGTIHIHPKINPKKEEKNRRPKHVRQHTTIHHQSTTISPSKNHVLHTTFLEIPLQKCH